MEFALIYCPDRVARETISLHLTQICDYQILFAETEQVAVSVALENQIKLLVLFDPLHIRSLLDLQDFLRQKRLRMRIRILPDIVGKLMPGWRKVLDDTVKPAKPRAKHQRSRSRFEWGPGG